MTGSTTLTPGSNSIEHSDADLKAEDEEFLRERVSKVMRVGKFVKQVPFDRLTTDELEQWNKLRASNPAFSLPFFSPKFSEAVDLARGDVTVGIVNYGNDVVGFLPFHRFRGIAVPVGRFFNDAHNIILAPGTEFDWQWFLREIDCKAFDFHAMVGCSDDEMSQYGHGTIQSFHANIQDDSEAFLAKLGKAHKTIGRQGQKTRKLGREVGPVRFEFDCRDEAVLMQVINWKRDQYQRTHILDLFTPDWTREMLFHLHRNDASNGDARGVLSVLRAGEKIVAAHFGIVENDQLHYWFPAYDPAFSIYSPGTGLFVEIIREATTNGIRCIDMGYGEQPYKLRQTDATGSVAFGTIARSKFHQAYRRMETSAISAVKKMPMKEHLKRVWRRIQPNAGISKLR